MTELNITPLNGHNTDIGDQRRVHAYLLVVSRGRRVL